MTAGRDHEQRAPWLEQDLTSFESHGLAETPRAQLEAILIAQELRHRALGCPASLLGALYVLEGAALGGQVLRHRVEKAFGLTGVGLTYLAGRESATSSHLKAFSQRMNEAVQDEALASQIIATAKDLFVALRRVLDALHPLETERLGDLVKILNVEAGVHQIAGDLHEIAVALRVGELSWQAFPYYEARYGARGRRFTRSDSSWLVTLCRLNAVHVQRHVLWLAGVLAARGMPRLMLEEHLLRMHDLLCATLPARKERYLPLLTAHTLLRNARIEHLPDASSRTLIESFEPKLQAASGVARLSDLLVAAVADEADGVAGAVSSLTDWIDDGRFGPDISKIVRGTMSGARAAVSSCARVKARAQTTP